MLSKYNEIVVDENDLVEAFLQGEQPKMVTMENVKTIDKYNHLCSLFLFDDHIDIETPAISNDKYNYKNADNWWMPDEYKTLDIEQYLYTKVCGELQIAPSDFVNNSSKWIRVEQELHEFKERSLLPLLQYMVYFVDTMRENNIVWGVGRGSSVASYVLYLIGVHKIDSIKYELNHKEFFR